MAVFREYGALPLMEFMTIQFGITAPRRSSLVLGALLWVKEQVQPATGGNTLVATGETFITGHGANLNQTYYRGW